MNKSLLTLLVLCLALCLPLMSVAGTKKKPAERRISTPATKQEAAPAATGDDFVSGEYWALIIGIDKYQSVQKLSTAVNDAKGVRDVLVARYGFRKDHIVELYDGEATGVAIKDSFFDLTRKVGENDSLFIYYAGHGQFDKRTGIGWWVPVEGRAQSPGTFIQNSEIVNLINGIPSRHTYLVADSCFSGTLFGQSRSLPPLDDKFYQSLYTAKSRWGLTSGNREPVADSGKGGHSVFAYFFIKELKDNAEPYLVPSHIYDRVAPLIANNSEQTPVSQPLKNVGDEGGQFVFRLASYIPKKPQTVSDALPAPVIPASAPVVAAPELPDEADIERARLEAELAKVESENLLVEKQEKKVRELAELKVRLEAEKKKSEELKVKRDKEGTNFSCYNCHSRTNITPDVTTKWLESAHGRAGVTCPQCHGNHDDGFNSPMFTANPGQDKCMGCHPDMAQNNTTMGKHVGIDKCTPCHARHSF